MTGCIPFLEARADSSTADFAYITFMHVQGPAETAPLVLFEPKGQHVKQSKNVQAKKEDKKTLTDTHETYRV